MVLTPLLRFSRPVARLALGCSLATMVGCASSTSSGGSAPSPQMARAITPPSPDPRVGLKAGLMDAGEAAWNLRLVSNTPPTERFKGVSNSDLAFKGNLVFQGNYNGWQIWDISNPAKPTIKNAFYCPASQSDVSVYGNLLFVSGEGNSGRLDCSGEGVHDPVSHHRLRGIRIFDITDIANPVNVGNVQTCRGSHTHSVVVDPNDKDNVYVYVSGSAPVRAEEELPGCRGGTLEENPNSVEFRIEVIKVPLAHPERAAIVTSPRIFNDLKAPPRHGEAPEDIAAAKRQVEAAKARGLFTAEIFGLERPIPPQMTAPMLDSIVAARGGSGTPTAADSAALRQALPGIIAKMIGIREQTGPTSCHDITAYPAIGLAGGACEGYGLLLDIKNPANPRRIGAVSDSNFSYWHSATFNNDGTKVLFTDEWGGGGAPKCRATDKPEWGADAIFTLENGKMVFQSYFKLPAPQTSEENCVAHNGSLIPIPGRDVMVQGWYQGGINVFDWTDAKNPYEIAFFDRGPVDANRMANGGSWSVYWYNGYIVSSEIARGLDIFELQPSAALSQNEIDAAKSVRYDYVDAQGQPKMVWPASFALSRAYADQLERSGGLPGPRIAAVRQALSTAERASGSARSSALNDLARELDRDAGGSRDAAKVRLLARSVRDLASAN